MAHRDTAEVIKRFNDSFLERDAAKLVDLVADDCVMESAQPAPNGARYEGYDACLRFWQELIADPEGSFEPEDVLVSGDSATIRWRFRFGEGEESSVRGVTLMHVRGGEDRGGRASVGTSSNSPIRLRGTGSPRPQKTSL